MEDRLPNGLYLEMTDLEPAQYAQARVDHVLGLGGVQRATWWLNVSRDRKDLPRQLPEFSVLGVYEVDASFAPPTASPDLVGCHHFRRTSRPGQGSLSGRPSNGLSLVLISARTEAGAQALRDWADFVHIRAIAEAAVPGFRMITPYEHASGGDPRFLHFYEMDTDDPEGAFQTMPRLVRARLDTAMFEEWATHSELRIMYVNSFRRVGERGPT